MQLLNKRATAFTLIELLVVIGIIGILAAIAVIVGGKVVESGKSRATADTIRVLDSAMADYVNRLGKIPDPVVRIELTGGSTTNAFAVIDGVYQSSGDRVVNTLGLFLKQAEGTGGVAAAIDQINPKFVRLYDADEGGPMPSLRTVFDAWDRPIRYVHPTWDGEWLQGTRSVGQAGAGVNLSDATASPIRDATLRSALAISTIRRNFLSDADRQATPNLVGDSDGGLCPSPRPYFYSAGEDGDPSTTDENVYSVQPKRVQN